MKINEESLRDIWDNIKHINVRFIEVPEGEEKEKGPEKIFEEIIAENVHKMGKETVIQVQEAQRVPGRINSRRNMPRHIVFKMTKIKEKEKILKITREKEQIMYKGIPINLSSDCSAEPVQARRQWHDIFRVIKGKSIQSRILYPTRL